MTDTAFSRVAAPRRAPSRIPSDVAAAAYAAAVAPLEEIGMGMDVASKENEMGSDDAAGMADAAMVPAESRRGEVPTTPATAQRGRHRAPADPASDFASPAAFDLPNMATDDDAALHAAAMRKLGMSGPRGMGSSRKLLAEAVAARSRTPGVA